MRCVLQFACSVPRGLPGACPHTRTLPVRSSAVVLSLCKPIEPSRSRACEQCLQARSRYKERYADVCCGRPAACPAGHLNDACSGTCTCTGGLTCSGGHCARASCLPPSPTLQLVAHLVPHTRSRVPTVRAIPLGPQTTRDCAGAVIMVLSYCCRCGPSLSRPPLAQSRSLVPKGPGLPPVHLVAEDQKLPLACT